MLMMRYDMMLEAEAQAYASSCPTNESAVASRPASGENFAIIPSSTSALDAAAVKSWWSIIFRNGINRKVVYTEFLERKPMSPRTFTQMAWAGSYRLGCGMSNCSLGRTVVCRYRPRGNVYQEQIYIPGPVCGSCFAGNCVDGLCPTPTV
ncbi:unnamed protein product [Strongylus vulgaris]|uniref:SCP domain-containing protein n=1 Tax=Strongylus vulgaris TaxID=40348 RepID=A0A3P7J5Q8_STRVU|nr:unnamed protein product [Strongylus vulgaris]